MNKKNVYLNLIYCLTIASDKFQKQEDYSSNLNKACNLINNYIKHSSNIAKTAFEIERHCLEYDRNINMKKSTDRIDSRLTGCLAAVKELNELQHQTKIYITDFLAFQPHNLNADTTYTKEAFNSLKYLGTEKNANYTQEAGYNFYEKRQETIKQGKQAFLKEKQQTFKHLQLQSIEKPLNKNKGLER